MSFRCDQLRHSASIRTLSILFVSAGLFIGQSAHALTLNELQDTSSLKTQVKTESTGKEAMRLDIIRDAAMALGVRAGFSSQSKKLLAEIDSRKSELDRLYHFNVMFTNSGVYIPPVIEETKDKVLTNGSVMRILSRSYRFLKRGYLALQAPTWRDYLLIGLDPSEPELPASIAMPKEGNDEEKRVWDEAVSKGWKRGIEQANETYQINQARLDREFMGMMLYQSMRERGLITNEIIAGSYVPVSGDKNHLNLNERVYQITQEPEMVLDGKKHKPIVKDGGAK